MMIWQPKQLNWQQLGKLKKKGKGKQKNREKLKREESRKKREFERKMSERDWKKKKEKLLELEKNKLAVESL